LPVGVLKCMEVQFCVRANRCPALEPQPTKPLEEGHESASIEMLAVAFLAATASRGLTSVNIDVDATGSGPAGEKIWPNFVG
jgi:hypothetical protein